MEQLVNALRIIKKSNNIVDSCVVMTNASSKSSTRSSYQRIDEAQC
ncbi:hypothetical protein HanXRQr2_Chr07g0298691 [Helianthus annuus]|uniref:Uncharacterized protein n=1 Tax=Helianthus annuus TaxID=4232 RepID=A0A9K3NGR3_HELAN|nr:hypothetical protein HanXRQr2_Chr07g0298691 [Helianthus annuus]